MWNLQAVNKLEDGTGLPTDMITMNVSVQLTMRNPNSHFTAFCDGGILQIGYATFDPLMQAGVSFHQSTGHGFEIQVSYMEFSCCPCSYQGSRYRRTKKRHSLRQQV